MLRSRGTLEVAGIGHRGILRLEKAGVELVEGEVASLGQTRQLLIGLNKQLKR